MDRKSISRGVRLSDAHALCVHARYSVMAGPNLAEKIAKIGSPGPLLAVAAKIGSTGPFLIAKTGPPLPILVPL